MLTFVFADHFNATGRPPSGIRQQSIAGRGGIMAAVIERAVERGEIDPRWLTPHIASLPVDLVRHYLIMNLAPVPDDTLVEIADRTYWWAVAVRRCRAARAGGPRWACRQAGRGHRRLRGGCRPWPALPRARRSVAVSAAGR